MSVNILFSSTQLMHLEVQSLLGETFLCSFVYVASTKTEHMQLYCDLQNIFTRCEAPMVGYG